MSIEQGPLGELITQVLQPCLTINNFWKKEVKRPVCSTPFCLLHRRHISRHMPSHATSLCYQKPDLMSKTFHLCQQPRLMSNEIWRNPQVVVSEIHIKILVEVNKLWGPPFYVYRWS